MKTLGRYDAKLQMFVDEPREADPVRLGYLRWLAEHGKLEHAPAGPSCGEYSRAGRFEPADDGATATSS